MARKNPANAASTPPGYPKFIDIPNNPNKVERCDWDPVNNEPSCEIIDRTPPRGARVRVAGPVPGIQPKHRAPRR
jgi:hypothetical protein